MLRGSGSFFFASGSAFWTICHRSDLFSSAEAVLLLPVASELVSTPVALKVASGEPSGDVLISLRWQIGSNFFL